VASQRLALSVLLVGTLAAFGGIYPWALPGIVGGAFLLALAGGAGPWRTDDAVGPFQVSLGLLAAAIALQLVPLPHALRHLFSPEAARVEFLLRPDALVRASQWGSLSLSPRDTWQALGLVVAAALTYRAALRVFAGGGVRQVARVLAVTGVVLSAVAIVQRTVSPGRIYGFWDPGVPGAQPFGPVINRNHLAAWFTMAAALACGYMIARLRTRMDGPVAGAQWRMVLRRAIDSGAVSMAAAWAAMAAAITAAQSRSGLIGLAVAFAVLWRGGSRRGWDPRLATVAGLLIAASAGLVAYLGDVPGIANRFAAGVGSTGVSRTVIWADTLPMIRDFWVAGVGAGAYDMAMVAYQQSVLPVPHLDTVWRFNHAHNHYLQVAAEGGLLLALPVLLCGWTFARVAHRRLLEERGELLWLRLGALGGLVGVVVQSLWEIPLTMPANALLAATLAAMVTYKRAGSA
jgi:O-antigen ligase